MENEQLILVGIGASAGGLEALKELIGHLPKTKVVSYVIAQHLSPTHSSLLIELLTPNTSLRVRELTDKLEPVPDTIYVTPPNQDVRLVDGWLRLTAPRSGPGPKPSVDAFFQSLSEEHGDNTVGIILSGTGSDGAEGVRALKGAGGVILVQDPKTAKYDGMPRAAIQTGCADLVLEPARMGAVIHSMLKTPSKSEVPSQDELADDDYGRIVALVKRATGFDLGHYKASTVNRRILRRMGLRDCTELPAYIEILRDQGGEATQLARDVLISVTQFMRDPEAYEPLTKLIEKMVAERSGSDVMRIWIPACASGEEAYSIGMLIDDACRKVENPPGFLLFATDIDPDAMELARAGVYSQHAVESLPKDFRNRYMEREGDYYRVRKSLRQNMVFARQNVVEDPPFSRMDLISCRNLLIYFTRQVQRRVLEIFHYALNANGFLFLGRSESIELHRELFSVYDKSARIFQASAHPPVYAVPMRNRTALDVERPRAAEDVRQDGRSLDALMRSTLADEYAPPAVLIDESDMIIRLFGDLDPYLTLPKNSPQLNIYEMVDSRIRAPIRALVQRSRREKQAIVGAAINMGTEENPDLTVQAAVYPVSIGKDYICALLAFEVGGTPATRSEREEIGGGALGESAVISELERELAGTREHLQTVVEELETSNEELQSQSEELQSSNEELQSTNEEMQTANEELQSTNEELLTVNDELQSKSQELSRLATDLRNVKDSLDSPLIVVDADLRVTQTNAATSLVLERAMLRPGMPLTSVNWKFDFESALVPLTRVIRGGESCQMSVNTTSQSDFLLRITPYQLADDQVGGAVLCFNEVREQLAPSADALHNEQAEHAALEALPDGLLTVDGEDQLLYANPAFAGLLGLDLKQIAGKKAEELLGALKALAGSLAVAELLEAARTQGNAHSDYLITGEENSRKRINVMAARLIGVRSGGKSGVLIVLRTG